ncbi:hypothetical protein M9Y10_024881 [Tritrichomonas musculus]|uniref:Uncharacterized protein n=1 Tax=Tritrichomonas musculus TaxID=1915356 RepID=A0ABR2HBI1_9EUKA
MPTDAKVSVVCNKEQSPVTPEFWNIGRDATYPRIVKFRAGRLNPNTNCQVSIISDSLDTEWKCAVKAVNCSAVDFSSQKKCLSGGAISIVVILVVAGIVVAVLFIIKKRKNSDSLLNF